MTQRCTLKKFAKEHVDFFCTLVADKKVRQYLGGVPTEEHIEKRINHYLSDSEDEFWIVQENQTGEFIGLISINQLNTLHEGEISYEFHPNWWGRGYAIETVLKVIEHTFSHGDYEKLVAITQSKNASSKKLLKSIGMQFIETKVMFGEEQSIYHLKKNYFRVALDG